MQSFAQRLSQEEVNQHCAEAKRRYLEMGVKEARAHFAYQLQGYIAAEVERGERFDHVMRRVGDLLGLVIKANTPVAG